MNYSSHTSGFRLTRDAFALNIGPEPWQKKSVTECYTAALESDLSFKLFLSFDMTFVSNFPVICSAIVLIFRLWFIIFKPYYTGRYSSSFDLFIVTGPTSDEIFANFLQN